MEETPLDNTAQQQLNLLQEEKKERMQEMCEYNRRLDRTILLYITSVYAAIGLRVTGKLDLTSFSKSPEFTMFSFLFIFLNLCIVIHGISQSAWSISLAKYIHVTLNEEIRLIFENRGLNFPDSINSWDEWTNDVKGLAVFSRDSVTVLWIILIFGISIYSLRIVDAKQFFSQYPMVTIISAGILILMQTFVFYLGSLGYYFASKFHQRSIDISIPKAKIVIVSVMISLAIVLICLIWIIK